MGGVIWGRIKPLLYPGRNEERATRSVVFDLLDRQLAGFKPRNLLDVGCGAAAGDADSGRITLRIAARFGLGKTAVAGVEISEFHVARCRMLFRTERVDIDREPLPFPDGDRDLVVCNQVLEHLKHWREALRELVRVTAPGGYLLVGVPNLAHLINRLYLLAGRQPLAIDLLGDHSSGFVHRDFRTYLATRLAGVELVGCASDLLYPLPYRLGRPFAVRLPNLAGFVGYLLRKS